MDMRNYFDCFEEVRMMYPGQDIDLIEVEFRNDLVLVVKYCGSSEDPYTTNSFDLTDSYNRWKVGNFNESDLSDKKIPYLFKSLFEWDDCPLERWRYVELVKDEIYYSSFYGTYLIKSQSECPWIHYKVTNREVGFIRKIIWTN